MQDDGTHWKGVYHHGRETGQHPERDGKILEYGADEKVAGSSSESSVGRSTATREHELYVIIECCEWKKGRSKL